MGGPPEKQADADSGPGEKADDKEENAPGPSLRGGNTVESAKSRESAERDEKDELQSNTAEVHEALDQARPWDAACERKEGAIGVHGAGEEFSRSADGWQRMSRTRRVKFV